MEIILLERVEKLGAIGDIVNVKPGFARNFLLPRGKALRASEANKKKFEADRARIEADNAKRRDIARAEAKDVDGASVTMIRQASQTGQLFGSVAARDLSGAVDSLLPVSHLAPGLYVVRLTVDGGGVAAVTVSQTFLRRP